MAGKGEDWLIKVGGKIIGPLTDREVSEKLLTREVRVIDEVSKPCGRWVYLRDEPRFAKTIEEVRLGNVGVNEETVTSTGAMDDVTKTPTNTVTIDDPSALDDLTEEITQSSVQEAMYQSFDDINKGGRDRRSKDSPSESYTYEGDRALEAKAKASTKWVGALTVSLILLVVAYVVFNQFIAKPIEDKSVAELNRTLGNEALKLGEYKSSLDYYRKAYEANSDDRGIYAKLGILEIQVGNQNVVGTRLLQKIRNWVGAEKKHVYTGMGLAALKDAEFEKANDYFDKALAEDPLFLPAVINLGVTALYLKAYQKANNFFQLALKDGSRDGIDLLLLVETLLRLYELENDKSYLLEAKRYLDGMRKVSKSYYEEILIASAYIELKLDNLILASEHIKSFLQRPLSMSKHYKHDIMVHRDQVDWGTLNQWCLSVTQKLDPESHIVSSEAKCLYLSGDLIAASRKIDDAVAQTPRDPLVQAVYAELLRNMNSTEKAKVATNKALDFNNENKYLLPIILQAKMCEEQKDYFCALNYWQEVLKLQPNSEVAYIGIGRSYFEDGHYADAKKYLALAKRLRTSYKPVLLLERDLEDVEEERGF